MSAGVPTVIRVGRKPAQLGALGTFFDGQSAAARDVRLHVDEASQALVIEGEGLALRWPLADVHAVPDQAGRDRLVLAVEGDALARLVTDEKRLAARFPRLHRPVVRVARSRIAAWALGALASVALIVFVLVPRMADQLADFIPLEGERALGQATLEQIRQALGRRELGQVAQCENPSGVSALRDMEARLNGGRTAGIPLTVHVLDHEMVNAFALPGGHVVLFDGLIRAAETPEQLAAVLAHEIGHVVSRDPTRHALRSAGSIGVLGLVFGDFAGGALVLLLAEKLINAQYSQAAEADADAFAHETLRAAGVSPAALGDMFATFRARHGDSEGVMAHFLSHPTLGDRIAEARAAVPAGFEARPLMGDAEWQALKGICR